MPFRLETGLHGCGFTALRFIEPCATTFTWRCIGMVLSSLFAMDKTLTDYTGIPQHEYQGTKQAEKSISELKEFASQLKALPQLSRHIALAEQLNRCIVQQSFRSGRFR